MQDRQNSRILKRSIDICMTILMLCLMAYQVTGEAVHEWTGIGMTFLVILHQVLNRRWYGAVPKGRYNAYRILQATVNILLLGAFALTAFSGMSMSAHAVPFLYGMIKVSTARMTHLAMSHWSFVLMGLHLGLHLPAMLTRFRLSRRGEMLLSAGFCCAAGAGLYYFLRNRMPDYLFFRVVFAFLDYEKPAVLVFLENLLSLLFWAFLGAQAAVLSRSKLGKASETKNPLLPVLMMMAAVIIGLVLYLAVPSESSQAGGFGGADWSAPSDRGTVLLSSLLNRLTVTAFRTFYR